MSKSLHMIARKVALRVLKPGDIVECIASVKIDGCREGERLTISGMGHDIRGGCIFLEKLPLKPFWPGFFKKVEE